MDQKPLVREQIEAGRELVRRFDDFAPVSVALWLQSDDEPWFLYLASDRFDKESVKPGYAEVLRLSGEIQDPHLNPFRVKLIGSDERLARESLTWLQRQPPTRDGIWYDGHVLGGCEVQGAYLYPLPAPATKA